jgi:hypothetical protein
MLDTLNKHLYPREDRRAIIRCSAFWLVILAVTGALLAVCIIFAMMASSDASIRSTNNTAGSSVAMHNQMVVVNGKSIRKMSISKEAVRLSSNMYYLGTRDHPRYGLLKGWIIVRENRNTTSSYSSSKSSQKMSRPWKEVVNSTANNLCSSVLAPGVKWKRTANYVLDTTNSQGLSESFIVNVTTQSMSAWNDVLVGFKVFGGRDTYHMADRADLNNPNGLNEILFAHLDDDRVIAYTSVWAIFDGPVQERQIVEADIVFNDKLRWGDSTVQGNNVMDGINTGVHECGHFAGMGHSADRPECEDDSMAPYSNYGETKKRTLSIYDKIGYCDQYSEYICSLSLPHENTSSPVPQIEPRRSNAAALVSNRFSVLVVPLVVTVFTIFYVL